jgi:hypothetical protein
MKASLLMLSAAIAVCVLPSPALPQLGGLAPYRPNMDFPPNWDPGPSGARPVRPSGPVPPINPFLRQNQGRPPNPVGPHGILPPEPGVGGIIDQGQSGNSNPPPSAQIPPEVLGQLTNPVVPKIDPPFVPAQLPGAAAAQQPRPAAPPWQGWEWVAIGIGVLCLLACLLRNSVERKRTAR